MGTVGKRKIWVIIPAYNEAKEIGVVIKKIKEKGLAVLIVDDGSVDNTFSIAEQEADKAIRNRSNFGKGRAIQEGIDYLFAREPFDYIITMDADGQHSPHDLDNFLKEAERGGCFVIGNRMGCHFGMPKLRVLTNKFMSWFISKIIGQKIPDSQCGFRLVKREVLEKIRIKTNKFEIESEILIKAARKGFVIKSIPIKSLYFKSVKSKIHPFLDTLRFVRFIFRLESERS